MKNRCAKGIPRVNVQYAIRYEVFRLSRLQTSSPFILQPDMLNSEYSLNFDALSIIGT